MNTDDHLVPLIRQDPPPKAHAGGSRGPASPFTLWAQMIRDRPGEWFLYPTPVWPSTATSLGAGRYAGTVAGEYEAVVRKIEGSKKWNIYARYVGNNPTTKATA